VLVNVHHLALKLCSIESRQLFTCRLMPKRMNIAIDNVQQHCLFFHGSFRNNLRKEKHQRMHLAVTILLLLLVVLLVSVLISWVIISRSNYTSTKLSPGFAYNVGERKFRFPDIPVRGDAYLLRADFIHALRQLLVATSKSLADVDLANEWWCTGGTLIGVERHASVPMPFDDDIDIAVDHKYKEFLFSAEFANAAKTHNLNTIRLFSNDHHSADKHGAAIRLQHANPELAKWHAAIDIFFWRQSDDDAYVKVDSWHNAAVLESTVERFRYADMFPLQLNVEVDDLLINLPNKPRAIIEKQYSSAVWDMCIARPLLFSHRFAFQFLQLLWMQT
jgi:hypothetical protein